MRFTIGKTKCSRGTRRGGTGFGTFLLPLKASGITQDAYVEYEWKKKRIWLFEEDFDTARQMYDQVEGAGAFMALAEKEREKLCYHAILCELDAGVTLRAVKFVSYDEALYERLVEINAIAKNGTAQVQTEDMELGWL